MRPTLPAAITILVVAVFVVVVVAVVVVVVVALVVGAVGCWVVDSSVFDKTIQVYEQTKDYRLFDHKH